MEYQDDHKVARGRHAWSRIKATAAEQRELWRIVGEALLVGRKLHPGRSGDIAFGKWCEANGFDKYDKETNPSGMLKQDRSGALWLAENWTKVEHRVPGSMGHPRRIREFMLKEIDEEADIDWPALLTEPLPADLEDIEAEVSTIINLDQRSAERLAKVINRAKGDEGSELQQRPWQNGAEHNRACPPQ